MRFFLFLILLTVVNINGSFCQKSINLNDFIDHIYNSKEIKLAQINLNIENNKYIIFKKKGLPEVAFNISLPNYNRSISSVLQPDGSYAFKEGNSATSGYNFSINQPIRMTGGSISFSNTLNRLDVFGKSTSYSSSLFNIGYRQPLNFFNGYKWDKKIENYNNIYENIIYFQSVTNSQKKGIELYFSFLINNEKLKLINEEINTILSFRKNALLLLKASKITKIDSLNIEISLIEKTLQKNTLINENQLVIKNINDFICNSLLIDESTQFETPLIPEIEFDAMYYVNSFKEKQMIVIQQKKMLPIQKKIEELRKNKYLQSSLYLSLGMNKSSDKYNSVYLSPNQSQSISLSITIPILDFGRSNLEYKNLQQQLEMAVLDNNGYEENVINSINKIFSDICILKQYYEINFKKEGLIKLKLQSSKNLFNFGRISFEEFSKSEQEFRDHKIDNLELIKKIYLQYMELIKLSGPIDFSL